MVSPIAAMSDGSTRWFKNSSTLSRGPSTRPRPAIAALSRIAPGEVDRSRGERSRGHRYHRRPCQQMPSPVVTPEQFSGV